MSLFPSAKEKATAEVDRFITSMDRLPTINDRDQLPYIQALMLELFRWGVIVTLGVPHTNVEEIVYEDWVIPKETTILTNIW